MFWPINKLSVVLTNIQYHYCPAKFHEFSKTICSEGLEPLSKLKSISISLLPGEKVPKGRMRQGWGEAMQAGKGFHNVSRDKNDLITFI